MVKTKGISTIISLNGKVLLLKRASKRFNGLWLSVAGKREEGENAIQTTLREIYEEIGITKDGIEAIYNADRCYTTYSVKDDSFYIYPTFFVILKPDAKITLNREHSEYKWCSAKEAHDLFEMPLQKEEIIYIDKYFIQSKPPEILKIEFK